MMKEEFVISKLTNQQEIYSAKLSFSRVFDSPDPFDKPFTDDTPKRLILFPVNYELDQARWSALKKAALAIGEVEALVTETEGYKKGLIFESWEHWKIGLTDYPYANLSKHGWSGLVENAIYSPGGKWGILVSHEEHAVLGGTESFVNAFKKELPTIDMNVRQFLSVWKDNKDRHGSNADWIPLLLTHLYGDQRGKTLLRDAGLS